MTTATKTTYESAAEIAERIANLKDLLRNADYAERAGLREEISQLETHEYPAAQDRDAKAAAGQRAAELQSVDDALATLGTELQPVGARRLALNAEIDYLLKFLPARDGAKALALADALKEIADVWKKESALNGRVAELLSRRDELQKGMN